MIQDASNNENIAAAPTNDSEFQALCNLVPQGFEAITGVAGDAGNRLVFIGTPDRHTTRLVPPNHSVQLLHFRPPDGSTDPARDWLIGRGWDIIEHSLPLGNVVSRSTVLVLDEMHSPVLSSIEDRQFSVLKQLTDNECRLLWVTTGYV